MKGLMRVLVICAAMCGLSASAVQIAVLQSGTGRHTDEFDTAFAELGWEQSAFNDTKPSLAEFNAKIDRYEMVLAGPLFGWQVKDFDPDVGPLRRWIEAGGLFVITDGSYEAPRGLVGKIDARLGGLKTGKCTSSQWSVNGYTSNAVPVHPLRAFPNLLTDGDSWPHFEEPSAGSPWRVITRCSEGKPVILFAELGKGCIMLSSLRQSARKAIENYYAYSQLRKCGLVVKDFTLTDLKPGPGRLEIELASAPPADTEIIYEVEQLDVRPARRQTFTAAFEGLSAAVDFAISIRGRVAVSTFVNLKGERHVLLRKVTTLPRLMEVGPNAYRGLLSTARRAPKVSFPVRFAPDREDLRGAKLVFSVFDAVSNHVVDADFALPTNAVPDEMWFDIPLDQKLGACGYRLDARLSKPASKGAKEIAARASTSFEIVRPHEAQTIIDEDGTFLVNGKTFFPLGIYHIPSSCFKTAADIGFNTVQFWSWDSGRVAYGIPREIYKAGANGLHCLFESNYHMEHVYREQAKSFADSPVMLMWYLADEPSEGQEKGLRERNALRHSLDRNHPTYVASCRPDLFKYHASFADVFAMDPYGDEASVIDWCRRAQREVAPHKPVVIVPWADRGKPEEIPLQAWTAIVHGVRGIIWYCWSQAGGGPLGVGIGKKPEQQAVFKKLIADINTVMPGLCNHNRRCFEEGPLHCMVTKGRNPLFLYVLNTGTETVEADFEVPEFRYVENVSLPLEKGGRLRITPGRFKATLAPGEIKVWRWQ